MNANAALHVEALLSAREWRTRARSRRSISFLQKEVGLLFMCFQASIRHQFAFMQRGWCNTPGFVAPNTGLDSVVGQPPTPKAVEQSWSTEYGQAPTTKFRFENFVRMKGSEYFFAPSLRFFAAL